MTLDSEALRLLTELLVLVSEALTIEKLELVILASALPGPAAVVSAYCACADSAVVRSATATVPSPAPVVNAEPIKATANRPIFFGFRITTGM